MDIQKEKEAFLNVFQFFKSFKGIGFSEETEQFFLKKNKPNDAECLDVSNLNQMWRAWWARAKAQAVPEAKAVIDVIAERKRQIEKEHYAIEHDDEYQNNELVRAAASYAGHVIARGWTYKQSEPDTYQSEEAPDLWPWDLDFWKPKDPRKDLVRAAALLFAEIERIDRIEAQEQGQ